MAEQPAQTLDAHQTWLHVAPRHPDPSGPPSWLLLLVTAFAMVSPIYITSRYLAPSPQMLLLVIGAFAGWCSRSMSWRSGMVPLMTIIFIGALLGTSPVSIIAFAMGCATGHFLCSSRQSALPYPTS